MTNCKKLIEIYLQGRDLYSEMASEIFKKPIEECGDGSIFRKNTKVVLLGIMYGMGKWTLAGMMKCTPDEAQAMIDEFYATYPEVKQWITNNEKEVVKQGYVETLWGTRRRFNHINFNILKKPWNSLTEADKKLRSAANRAMRQTTNFKVQGGAAMQTKMVMVALGKRLRELNEVRGKEVFQLLAQVHDEMLFLVPEDITPEELSAIEDTMVNTLVLVTGSKTDMALGNCWGKLWGASVEDGRIIMEQEKVIKEPLEGSTDFNPNDNLKFKAPLEEYVKYANEENALGMLYVNDETYSEWDFNEFMKELPKLYNLK